MKTYRILAIDGGGVRGIIPAMMIRELEKLTGKSMAEQFDLIAGTSTGGFLTLLLTKPGQDGRALYSGQDIVDLYVNHAKDIFHRSRLRAILSLNGWLRPKYPESSVLSTFETYLNKNQAHKLSEVLTDVLITGYEIERREAFYFQRCTARENADWDFYLTDVARSTTAAPTIFPAVEIHNVNGNRTLKLIDGGLVANNPAALALAEAIRQGGEYARYLVVTLGTGSYEAPLLYKKAKNWGLLAWATRIADVLFDGNSHLVETSTKEIVQALNRPPGEMVPLYGQVDAERHYYRFQVQLNQNNDGTDDVDPDNISDLQEVVLDMIDKNRDVFKELAEKLK
ncbi:MAG: patatin-like phospholipase family protein [Acidobacteria bacterium]|nr:patatin-like phospholipase family protein [Acidobacteriota bacterium]